MPMKTTMKYRRLGGSGLLVSELSFGSWVTFSNQLDAEKVYELMKTAYEHGVNFFDNAEVVAYLCMFGTQCMCIHSEYF
jgi:aryl-alcohol dehydrogenase-like predicted oxidoreductase